MHKDDQMTPKERAFALFAGKPVDRMPIKLFSPYIGMNFGASYQDAFVEAKSRAHWLIESYKRFGQDGLSVNYRIDGIPVAFGAESTYDPLGIPMIKENILKDFSINPIAPSISKSVAQTLYRALKENKTEKTNMLSNEWRA